MLDKEIMSKEPYRIFPSHMAMERSLLPRKGGKGMEKFMG